MLLPPDDSIPGQDAIKDCNLRKHTKDALNNRSVRVVSGLDLDSAFKYVESKLNLDDMRYTETSGNEDFVYRSFYDANDNLVSAYKINIENGTVSLHFPDLLLQDGFKLLTQDGEGLLL